MAEHQWGSLMAVVLERQRWSTAEPHHHRGRAWTSSYDGEGGGGGGGGELAQSVRILVHRPWTARSFGGINASVRTAWA